jgi:hypothetical protein
MIKEYDSDFDGNMNFEEFCQLVLPSTNQTLREIALLRGKRSYSDRSYKPITFET